MSRAGLDDGDLLALLGARRRLAVRAAALGFLALVFLVAAGIVAMAGAGTAPAGLALLPAGVGVLGLTKLWPALRRVKQVGEDLHSGGVEVVSREISVDIAIGLGILGVQHPRVRAGEEVFEIDRARAARLKTGRVYRLRVAPKSRLLLGIEEPEETAATERGRA